MADEKSPNAQSVVLLSWLASGWCGLILSGCVVFFALTFSPEELPRDGWYVLVLGGLMFLGMLGWLIASLKARRMRKQKLVRGLPLWLQASLIVAGMVLGVVGGMLSVAASMEMHDAEQSRLMSSSEISHVFDKDGNMILTLADVSEHETRSAQGSLLVWMCFGLMGIGGTLLEARPAEERSNEPALA